MASDPEHRDMDEPVNIEGIGAEDALRLLLQVDPSSDTAGDEEE